MLDWADYLGRDGAGAAEPSGACCVCAAGVVGWDCGVEPLRPTVEPSAAAAKMLAVATFIRPGVSQVSCRAWSQDRAPLAPAIAAIAHAAHIA
jgi:hypothetical protein